MIKYPVTFSSRLVIQTFIREGVEKFCNLMGPLDRGSHPYELLNAVRDMTSGSQEELINFLEKSSLMIQPVRGEKQQIRHRWEAGVFVLQYIQNAVCFRMRIRFNGPGLRKKIVFSVISDNSQTVERTINRQRDFSEIRRYEQPSQAVEHGSKHTEVRPKTEVRKQPEKVTAEIRGLEDISAMFDQITLADLFSLWKQKQTTR